MLEMDGKGSGEAARTSSASFAKQNLPKPQSKTNAVNNLFFAGQNSPSAAVDPKQINGKAMAPGKSFTPGGQKTQFGSATNVAGYSGNGAPAATAVGPPRFRYLPSGALVNQHPIISSAANGGMRASVNTGSSSSMMARPEIGGYHSKPASAVYRPPSSIVSSGSQNVDHHVNGNKLWIEKLPVDLDFICEEFLFDIFQLNSSGQTECIKLGRNPNTNRLAGNGSVMFTAAGAAQRCLETMNGKPIPGTYPARLFCLKPFVSRVYSQLGSAMGALNIDDNNEKNDLMLWIGGLPVNATFIDNEYIYQLIDIKCPGQVVRVDLRRHLSNNALCGFGFITFASAQAAQHCLATMEGKPIPGTGNPPSTFQLKPYTKHRPWVAKPKVYSAPSARAVAEPWAAENELSLHVSHMSHHINEADLMQAFAQHYSAVKKVRIIRNKYDSWRSRGFGFVHFTDRDQLEQAAKEMDGFMIKGCAIQVALATAAAEAASSASSLQGDGEVTRGGECCVCYDKPVDCVLYKCGHEVMCFGCAEPLKANGQECPLCRAEILDVIKTFRG